MTTPGDIGSSVDRPTSEQTSITSDAEPQGASPAVRAPREPEFTSGVRRTGMFGDQGSGDTSGFGLLVTEPYTPQVAERPYGGWYDDVADALLAAFDRRGIPRDALLRTTIAHDEITFYLAREQLQAIAWAVRDEPDLRFEMLSSLSGVDYGDGAPNRLHVVYELLSMTYRRRIRLEVAAGIDDPYVPSLVPVYPTADWHEREAYDMFGVIFAGHPALTRILMPDDWEGHPQRKDYPLNGIPVEFKGAEIPPPDERRVYS